MAISEYKRQLEKSIEENMKLLTGRLDGMVFTLSETDAELVGLWQQTRIMVDFPVIETQAKVVVTDKVTEEFVYQAEVQFVKGAVVLKAFTNVSGEAEFKGIKQGLYLFKVNAPGYKPYQVIEQRLFKGRINRFDVGLEPEE